VKYVKQKFHDVYVNTFAEQRTPVPGAISEKLRKTGELEGIKGKLDFQDAMKDLTKNYEFLKEKSLKSIDGIEINYGQILTALEELTKRVENYNVKDIRSLNKDRPENLSEEEQKLVESVLQDLFGFIGYTNASVSAALDNNSSDINTLKGVISEYHDILEDKIKVLPSIISSTNLNSMNKNKEVVYELMVGELDNSEKNSHNESVPDFGLKKEIKFLESQVKHWKEGHKLLFDVAHENMKLLNKMMKSKEMGSDGLRTLKDLYSQSTQKLKDLVQKHYSFHYKRSKRDKYRREKSNLMLNSSSQDIKSGGLIPPKENIDPKVHQNLLKALKNLKQEMNDLTIENQNKEEKILELDNLRTRHNLLKTEYNESKTAIFNLEADLETKESDINSLS